MRAIPRRIAHLVVGIMSVPLLASAQDVQPPAPGRAVERIEQFKKIRMMELLRLDEQTSIKFFSRYNKHQEFLKDLRQKQIQAMQRIQDLRKNKASDTEYGKVIDDLRSLENQINDAKSKYIDELKDVLSNEQIAEYLVFEIRFQQNLRDIVRDLQRNRLDAPRK
jgi:hypothetical protein